MGEECDVIGARALTMLPSVMEEKWQKRSSPPWSGVMKPNPRGFQRPATPVLRSPRGGGDDPYPPRAGERDRLRDLPRGDRLRLRSRRSSGERERLRRAGASSHPSSPSSRGASLSRGLSWGLAMVVQPWVPRICVGN